MSVRKPAPKPARPTPAATVPLAPAPSPEAAPKPTMHEALAQRETDLAKVQAQANHIAQEVQKGQQMLADLQAQALTLQGAIAQLRDLGATVPEAPPAGQ